jgi:formate-dependent nitrite reductase cytochrome c552 subunit
MLKRQGQFEAGEKARIEALKTFKDFYDKEGDIQYQKNMSKAAIINAKNKGTGSVLAQEKLEEKTETDIQKAIKDRTKSLEEKLNIARLGSSPQAKAKVTELETQIKKIEDDIRANYKKQSVSSAAPGPNKEDESLIRKYLK